jgi:hypothetical protein
VLSFTMYLGVFLFALVGLLDLNSLFLSHILFLFGFPVQPLEGPHQTPILVTLKSISRTELWLKWKSAYLASARSWVQTLVQPKKKKLKSSTKPHNCQCRVFFASIPNLY